MNTIPHCPECKARCQTETKKLARKPEFGERYRRHYRWACPKCPWRGKWKAM